MGMCVEERMVELLNRKDPLLEAQRRLNKMNSQIMDSISESTHPPWKATVPLPPKENNMDIQFGYVYWEQEIGQPIVPLENISNKRMGEQDVFLVFLVHTQRVENMDWNRLPKPIPTNISLNEYWRMQNSSDDGINIIDLIKDDGSTCFTDDLVPKTKPKDICDEITKEIDISNQPGKCASCGKERTKVDLGLMSVGERTAYTCKTKGCKEYLK